MLTVGGKIDNLMNVHGIQCINEIKWHNKFSFSFYKMKLDKYEIITDINVTVTVR